MNRNVSWGWLALLLAGCASLSAGGVAGGEADPPQEALEGRTSAGVRLPDLGPAPELHDGVWLNVTEPLQLAGLRGQVVLLDMWTFG